MSPTGSVEGWRKISWMWRVVATSTAADESMFNRDTVGRDAQVQALSERMELKISYSSDDGGYRLNDIGFLFATLHIRQSAIPLA